jgi:hypothetical protein
LHTPLASGCLLKALGFAPLPHDRFTFISTTRKANAPDPELI